MHLLLECQVFEGAPVLDLAAAGQACVGNLALTNTGLDGVIAGASLDENDVYNMSAFLVAK